MYAHRAKMEVSWNRGTPSHPLFLSGIFPNKNQPAIGYPHDYGNPHMFIHILFLNCSPKVHPLNITRNSLSDMILQVGRLDMQPDESKDMGPADHNS